MNNKKVLMLSALGGALEVYDFIIFVFFAWLISQLFFPADMPETVKILQSFAIFVTGYIARPIGGLVMAHYADRMGRKKMFLMSLMLMAIPTLLMGMLPTYQQIGYFAPILLLLLRVLHGAAIGGEVPSAWVFVAEHAPEKKCGLFLGLLQAGLTSGYLLGAVTVTVISNLYSEQEMLAYAWRIPFVFGGLLAVFAAYLRRWLCETPVFIELKQQRLLSKPLPIAILLREHRQTLMPAILLTSVLTSTVVIQVVTLPTIMQQTFHMSAKDTFYLSSLGIICLSISCIMSGWLSDRIGMWKTFFLYSSIMPVGIFLFMLVSLKQIELLNYAYMLSGLACGVIGVVPSIMVKLFPAKIRVSGISFTYNLTYSIIGAVLPLIIIGLTPINIWTNVYFALIMSMIGTLTFKRFSQAKLIHY